MSITRDIVALITHNSRGNILSEIPSLTHEIGPPCTIGKYEGKKLRCHLQHLQYDNSIEGPDTELC